MSKKDKVEDKGKKLPFVENLDKIKLPFEGQSQKDLEDYGYAYQTSHIAGTPELEAEILERFDKCEQEAIIIIDGAEQTIRERKEKVKQEYTEAEDIYKEKEKELRELEERRLSLEEAKAQKKAEIRESFEKMVRATSVLPQTLINRASEELNNLQKKVFEMLGSLSERSKEYFERTGPSLEEESKHQSDIIADLEKKLNGVSGQLDTLKAESVVPGWILSFGLACLVAASLIGVKIFDAISLDAAEPIKYILRGTHEIISYFSAGTNKFFALCYLISTYIGSLLLLTGIFYLIAWAENLILNADKPKEPQVTLLINEKNNFVFKFQEKIRKSVGDNSTFLKWLRKLPAVLITGILFLFIPFAIQSLSETELEKTATEAYNSIVKTPVYAFIGLALGYGLSVFFYRIFHRVSEKENWYEDKINLFAAIVIGSCIVLSTLYYSIQYSPEPKNNVVNPPLYDPSLLVALGFFWVICLLGAVIYGYGRKIRDLKLKRDSLENKIRNCESYKTFLKTGSPNYLNSFLTLSRINEDSLKEIYSKLSGTIIDSLDQTHKKSKFNLRPLFDYRKTSIKGRYSFEDVPEIVYYSHPELVIEINNLEQQLREINDELAEVNDAISDWKTEKSQQQTSLKEKIANYRKLLARYDKALLVNKARLTDFCNKLKDRKSLVIMHAGEGKSLALLYKQYHLDTINPN